MKRFNLNKESFNPNDNIPGEGYGDPTENESALSFSSHDINIIAEKLYKLELLALCQSYCHRKSNSLIDYTVLLRDIDDQDYIKNVVFYTFSIPSLRENGLKKLFNGVMTKNNIGINMDTQVETTMSHSKFQELIDDYLAYDIEDKEQIAFEEHLLACDSCSEIFFINKDIVNIFNICGNELFINLIIRDSKTTSDINRPVSDAVFINMCLKEHFIKEGVIVANHIHKGFQKNHKLEGLNDLLSKDIIKILKDCDKHHILKDPKEIILNFTNGEEMPKIPSEKLMQKDHINRKSRRKKQDTLLSCLMPLITLMLLKILMNISHATVITKL